MTTDKKTSSFRELDEVCIGQELANSEGVEQLGTIVWYVEGAPYATVECAVLGERGAGVRTKLLDVKVQHLQITSSS